MKALELHQKTENELQDILSELSKEQFNLRMQKGTGQLAKPDQVKKVRRNIARINTVLNEKKRKNND